VCITKHVGHKTGCWCKVVGRLERQLQQTLHQLQSEQQRTADSILEKDRQVDLYFALSSLLMMLA